MFTLLLRKMRNTKWMVFCLLIGFIMASAMMSTIPIYMNASLQRMLVKDMDAFQEEFMIYPGSYNTSRSFKSGMATDTQLQTMKDYVKTVDEQFAALDLPDVGSKKVMLDTYLYCKSFSIADGESAARLTVGGMSDITEHSAAASGRMMQKGQRDDGVFECMATEKSLKTNGLALDTVYEIANVMGGDASIKIEIVGLLDVADENDPYWAEGIDEAYTATVFTDYDTMLDEMLPTGAVNLSKASYNYFIDYTRLDIAQLGGINNSYNKQKETFKKSSIGFTMRAKDMLSDYAKRS